MKKAINIRIEESLLEDLDHYAREMERTRTYLIEKAVGSYFDTLDELIADKRIDDIKKGNSVPVPLEEVFRKAGIDV